MSRPRLIGLGFVAAVGLFLTGCALYAYGYGAINSTVPGQKATFAFAFDGPKKFFRGNYADRAAGVVFTAEGLVSYQNDPGNYDNCAAATVKYKSQVKGKPGEGTAMIVACQRAADPLQDSLVVQIDNGPLGTPPYLNGGPLTSGKIEAFTQLPQLRGDDFGERREGDDKSGKNDNDRKSDNGRGNEKGAKNDNKR